MSGEKWLWDAGACDVSFDLENLTHNQINVHVAIRAHRKYLVGRTAWRSEVVSESTEVVSLQPSEKRRIERNLKVPIEPDLVLVSAWN